MKVSLRVGGFVPLTTVDFPGRLSAVVFCQGCPWRCVYCHNTHLQQFETGRLPWDAVVRQLEDRRGFLDAVVFSGGEPTAQPGLPAAMAQVRTMGFAIGLHTAGMIPGALRCALPLVDWVGFDVKAPLDARYDGVAGQPGCAARVLESLGALVESGVDYEIRTTLDLRILDETAREDIARQLSNLGVKPTRWQQCLLR